MQTQVNQIKLKDRSVLLIPQLIHSKLGPKLHLQLKEYSTAKFKIKVSVVNNESKNSVRIVEHLIYAYVTTIVILLFSFY